MDLADRFPLLSALVERRPGGQRRLPIGEAGRDPGPVEGGGSLFAPSLIVEEAGRAAAGAPGAAEPEPAPAIPPATSVVSRELSAGARLAPDSGGPGARRAARYGLSIQFETRPDDSEPSRLVESTVWINEAHPAYRRALASRSEGYHIALAAAMALAPLAVEREHEHAFINEFLTSWGESLERRRRRARR